VEVQTRDGSRRNATIAVAPRDWPIERIDGVPPDDGESTARNRRAHRKPSRRHLGGAASATTTARTSRRPSSGRYRAASAVASATSASTTARRSTRIRAWTSPPRRDTPVLAPAAGVITFANPDLYLTGGTVLLDHGHGVSSNFLHLSRIDVKVGDRVAQGQVIGAVGATGAPPARTCTGA
jgi:murein DD-endopeptidase MepM/ murein hydrolase activator NlpD